MRFVLAYRLLERFTENTLKAERRAVVAIYAGVDTIRLLHGAMKVAEKNQRIIANNVANVDTPNFTPQEMDFQTTLRAVLAGGDRISLRKSHPRHLDASRSTVGLEGFSHSSKNDYNKVDIDEEMVKLSENTGRYVMYSTLMVRYFRNIRDMLNNTR